MDSILYFEYFYNASCGLALMCSHSHTHTDRYVHYLASLAAPGAEGRRPEAERTSTAPASRSTSAARSARPQ